ncbi:MAG: lytic murein transglycosylase B [Luteimonas sp.]
MIRRALVCLLPFALAACATQAPPAVPAAPAPMPPPPPQPVPPPVSVKPAPVGDLAIARGDFARETAAKYRLDAAMIEDTLARAQIRDGIIAAMSRPAEGKPWRDYRPIFITPARIDGGRAFLAAHRDALARAEATYGVPPEVIVAIIGVETSYGANKGSYPVVDALYTLAFRYPRTNEASKVPRENAREAFFRDELAQMFVLGREANMGVAALQGSYAGAMGWGQFMPSSYREYAVDGDGDGKRDLINDLDDVFPSIANYFIGRGKWQRGGPVMVRAMRDASAAEFNAETIDPVHTLAALAAKGYRPSQPVAPNQLATVIKLDGVNGPEYWMVFRNFQAITKYNSSRLYATAVHQLSQAIAGRDVPGA